MYNRKRDNISDDIIEEIVDYFASMSLTNILDLPIIYNEEYTQHIDYSCILKDKKTDKILTIIV